MQLLLIRHATTLANEQGLWIGQTESEISAKGEEELKVLKKLLTNWQITRCFTSPSKRAVQTAETVLKEKCLLESVEALKEIDFGEFEGKNFEWAKQYRPLEVEKMLEEGDEYCYPMGESMPEAHARIVKWLRTWLQSKPQGNYLVCAHGGTIRSILSELLAQNSSLHWHFKIEPASLTRVSLEEDFAVIETLNQK